MASGKVLVVDAVANKETVLINTAVREIAMRREAAQGGDIVSIPFEGLRTVQQARAA
jgi:hypothetical protein